MSDCSTCGQPLSPETGITASMGGDSEAITYYCAACDPNKGRGWTLSDVQQMREDAQAARAEREMMLMNRIGPDVYFAIKTKAQPNE